MPRGIEKIVMPPCIICTALIIPLSIFLVGRIALTLVLSIIFLNDFVVRFIPFKNCFIGKMHSRKSDNIEYGIEFFVELLIDTTVFTFLILISIFRIINVKHYIIITIFLSIYFIYRMFKTCIQFSGCE